MKRLVVAINGSAETGKDTFIKYVERVLEDRGKGCKVMNESSIDPVKLSTLHLGWNGHSKREEDRALMCGIKQLWDLHYDGSFKYCVELIKKAYYQNTLSDWCLFIHIREPKNIRKLQDHVVNHRGGIDFKTLLVKTEREVECYGNNADRGVENMHYDITVVNDDLKRLLHYAEKFVDEHLMKEDQ